MADQSLRHWVIVFGRTIHLYGFELDADVKKCLYRLSVTSNTTFAVLRSIIRAAMATAFACAVSGSSSNGMLEKLRMLACRQLQSIV
jgi:hypothetical protein